MGDEIAAEPESEHDPDIAASDEDVGLAIVVADDGGRKRKREPRIATAGHMCLVLIAATSGGMWNPSVSARVRDDS